MQLKLLKSISTILPDDLVRMYHQSQLEWSRHLGDEMILNYGRWISNPGLKSCAEANCVLDAFVVPGTTADETVADINARSAQFGATCHCCTLSSSMPGTVDLAQALLADGWHSESTDILYRTKAVKASDHVPNNLAVIPGRSSFRHYRQLMNRASVDPEAAMLHLDDSRFDSLLALREGHAVGCIGLLTSGEIGTVRDWYVAPEHRHHGIGRLLMDRALEISSRSVLRHVMIGLPESSEFAVHICQDVGFETVAQCTSYHRNNRTV